MSTPEITTDEDGNTVVSTRKSGDVAISGGLPADFKPGKGFDPDDPGVWQELMNSTDATKRKSAMDVLKALGYNPTKYIHWEKDERALVLAAHSQVGNAEQGDEPEVTETKTSSKTAKKTAKKSSSKTAAKATVDLSEVNSRLDALSERVRGLETMLTDAHYLIRVLVAANPDAQDFVPELVDDLHGELAVEVGNDEG